MPLALRHRSSAVLFRLAVCGALVACLAGPVQAQRTGSLESLKSLSLEELLSVEVTSVSRSAEKLSETASAIQVVTDEEIRRSGATAIPEALRLATNLNIAQKNSHSWGISARGFNTELSNKLLVMMDGRTLYTPLFSGVRWDVQHYLLEDLHRIEVVSGPGGSLWGANAVNGVINITSKTAAETQGLYAEAGLGTTMRSQFGVRYGGAASSDVFYRVYALHFDADDQEFADGSPAGDGWTLSQAGFRIDAQPSFDTHLTFQGDAYEGEIGEVGGEFTDVSGHNLLGRWTQTFASGADLALQVYFDHTEFDQPSPATVFSPPGRFGDVIEIFDVDFHQRLPATDAVRLVWGLGYRHIDDDVRASPSLALFPARMRQDYVSGFAQAEFALTPALSVTTGSKVEHTDYTGWDVEPTLRIQYTVTDGHLLWAAVSRAVRTPSRIDHDISQPATPPVILLGGSDFRSENLLAYEAGYRAQFGPRFAATLAAFYNRYDDVRSLRPTPGTFIPLVFGNDLEADTHGVELTATWQVADGWRLRAGYNWLEEDVRIRPGGVDFNNALNETGDPEHQASLRSSHEFGRAVEFDAQLRWVDTLRLNNVGVVATVPSYVDLDLRLGWRLSAAWELSLVGRNLLHARHVEYGLPSPTRVEIARSVFAKAAWRF